MQRRSNTQQVQEDKVQQVKPDEKFENQDNLKQAASQQQAIATNTHDINTFTDSRDGKQSTDKLLYYIYKCKHFV